MSAKPAEEKKRKCLTPRQTREAIELWEQGAVTLEDLAKRFDKHKDTFARLFRRVGAVKGAKKAQAEELAQKQVEEDLLKEAAEIRAKVKETRDQSYNLLKGVTTLVGVTIAKAREENRALGTIEKDLKSLKLAAEAIEIARRGRYDILGLSKDNPDDEELPALEIIEKADDEIRAAAEAALAQVEDEDLDDIDEDDEDAVIAEPVKGGSESAQGSS